MKQDSVKPQFDAISGFILDPDLVIPEDALHHCSTLLIDTLGVAAGATALEVGNIARDFACDFHAAGSDANAAHMLFDGRRVSLPGAAWALATQIDNLDGHDGFNPTKGHIGCAVTRMSKRGICENDNEACGQAMSHGGFPSEMNRSANV